MKPSTKLILGVVAFVALLVAIGLIAAPTANTSSTSHGTSSIVQPVSTSGPSQPYQDPTYNFTVQVPGQWEIFRNPSPSSGENATNVLPVLSTHPAQGLGGSFVVSVDKAPSANSSSQYAAVYKAKLAQMFSGDGITVTSTANATLGGIPAYRISYVVHFPSSVGGDCGPVTDIVTLHDSRGYIVSFDDCNSGEESANLPLFMDFASSFAFRQ